MQLIKSDYLHQPRNNAIDDQKLVLNSAGREKRRLEELLICLLDRVELLLE